MLGALFGLCIETAAKPCPPGSTRVPGFVLLSGAFGLIALIGLAWLAWRSRKGP